MTRKLTIERKKAFQGCAIDYYARIDTKAVARLGNGEVVTVEIPVEEVTLDVLAKAMKSEPVTIPAGSCDLYAEVRHKVGLWATSLEVILR